MPKNSNAKSSVVSTRYDDHLIAWLMQRLGLKKSQVATLALDQLLERTIKEQRTDQDAA